MSFNNYNNQDLKNNKITNLGDPSNNLDAVNLQTLEDKIKDSQVYDSQVLSPVSGVGDSFANAINLTNKDVANTIFADASSGDLYVKLPFSSAILGNNFPIKIKKIDNTYNRVFIYVNTSSFERIIHPVTGVLITFLALSQPQDYLSFKNLPNYEWATVEYDTSSKTIANVAISPLANSISVGATATVIPPILNSSDPTNFDSQGVVVYEPSVSDNVIKPKVSGWYKIKVSAIIEQVGTQSGNFRFLLEKYDASTTSTSFIARRGFVRLEDLTLTSTNYISVVADFPPVELDGDADYLIIRAKAGNGSGASIRPEDNTRGMEVTLDRKTYT